MESCQKSRGLVVPPLPKPNPLIEVEENKSFQTSLHRFILHSIFSRRAYTDPYFTGLMEEAYKEWQELEEQTGVELVKYEPRDGDDDCLEGVCYRETGLLCFSDDLESPWLGAIIDSLAAQVFQI